MTRRSYAGGAAALVLNGGINGTALSISTTGTATGWPDGSGGKFLLVIDRGTASEEKILATSRSGNTITVGGTGDRGVDNTSAASHSSGATIEHCVGAMDLDEPNRHINTTGDDNHTQYLNTARHDVTARHAFGAALGTPGTPAASAPGDAGTVGVGTVPSRSDHQHPREAAITIPRVRLTFTADQSIPNSGAIVTWDTEAYDTDTMHTGSSSRITFTTAGYYTVTGLVAFPGATGGSLRRVNIILNVGAAVIYSNVQFVNGAGPSLVVAFDYQFAAADYIQLVAYQDSGGAISAFGTTSVPGGNFFAAHRISP